MERQSTGEPGIEKDYYEIIDILADIDDSKLKFFITVGTTIESRRTIELTEEEFRYYLTDDKKFKVNYREDGVVEIYIQIAADKVLESIKDRVFGIISETWNDE